MKRTITLAFLAASILCVVPKHALAASGLKVSAMSHGVRVVLVVPKSVYPKNALVQVTVTVHNMTGRAVTLGARCSDGGPQVDVTSPSGRKIYPPSLLPAPLIVGGCFHRAAQRIAPHRSLVVRHYVVLYGPGIRASVRLVSGIVVETRPATVSLTHGQVPTVMLSTRGGLHAIVQHPPNAQGPLLFRGWWSCLQHGMRFSHIDPTWTSTKGNIAWPMLHGDNCTRITVWHTYAGYVNTPVAIIAYGVKSRILCKSLSCRFRI
jgi:hypothetical protein